jgi:hypothetical protein
MTAVEFLASVLSQTGPITEDDFNSLVKQAKEMELDKLKEAYSMGRMGKSIKEFNETFKSEQ